MSIAIGYNNISKMFLGSAEIKVAYLGEQLVFSGKKPSRLPEGYIELEYVQSAGTNVYLNTGISSAATAISKVVMDVEPLTTSGGSIFGASKTLANNVSYYFQAYKLSTGQVRFSIGTQDKSINTDISSKRVTVTLDRTLKIGKIDNLSTEEFTQNASYETLTLLVRRGVSSSGVATMYNYLPAKLYSCQIYDANGNICRDYVPCQNPYGKVGMFDLVNNSFSQSAGTADFTAGPAV